MGPAEFEEAWRRRHGGRIQEQRRHVEFVVMPGHEHQAKDHAIQAGVPAAAKPRIRRRLRRGEVWSWEWTELRPLP